MLVAILAAANTIGSLPLIIALAKKTSSDPGLAAKFAENPGDLSVLGIDPNLGLLILLIPFVAGLAAFILLIKPLHLRTFKMTINGTGKIRWNRFFISGLLWFLLSAVYMVLYMKIDPSNFTVNNSSKSLIGLVIISLIFIPFQAALEEVVFRGYLMQGFAVLIRNRWFPLLITSLFFGLLHSFNPEVKDFGFFTMMPHYIVFGLIFGAITLLDDGIEAAMGAHAANNIFLCIMVTQASSTLQTASVFEQHIVYPWQEFALLIISGVLFILILKIIFRWKYFTPLIGNEENFVNQIP